MNDVDLPKLLRSVRRLLVGVIVGFVVVVGALATGFTRIGNETEAREEDACVQAIRTRAEQEQLLVDIVTQLGGRARIIDTVHDAYAGLPDPASCS